jgi:hypothetical protein
VVKKHPRDMTGAPNSWGEKNHKAIWELSSNHELLESEVHSLLAGQIGLQ